MARYYTGSTQPLGRWNNVPIYLTTIVTAILVAGLIVCVLAITARVPGVLAFLSWQSPLFPAWSIWRALTYVVVGGISFFTPFSILCFYWFSVGIETHLGRVTLTRLLLALTLTPPVIYTFWWLAFGVPGALMGSYLPVAGLLVAFATLYPNSEAWGWVPFKWIAFACILCGSLMYLADHDWISISALWANCAVGFGLMRLGQEQHYDDYVSPFAKLKGVFRRKPKFRVMPSPQSGRTATSAPEPSSELDAILDKIAKTGMGSLTAREKAQLEKAREALMRKDQR